jgi:hypothetical protein
MEYYFEASEILDDPDANPDLAQFVRLKVADLKEAADLAAFYEKKFPPGKGYLEIHEHDHRNNKPCKKIDLRPVLENLNLIKSL